MAKRLQNIMPAGAPWGGPESVSLLSCFASLVCAIEGFDALNPLYCCQGPGQCKGCGECGSFVREQKQHEQVYHLSLTLSGLACLTPWPLQPQNWDWRINSLHRPWQILDKAVMDEALERMMHFAGYSFADVTTNLAEVVHASIDAGWPAMAYDTHRSEWFLITGYDGSDALDYDGNRIELGGTGLRVVAVTGRRTRRVGFAEEFQHLAGMLRGDATTTTEMAIGWAAYDAVAACLADEAYFQQANSDELQRVYGSLHACIGALAENRCFAAMAMLTGWTGVADLEDMDRSILAVLGGFFMETHNQCWQAWAAMGGNHICEPAKHSEMLRGRDVRMELQRFFQRFRRHDEVAALLLEEAVNTPFLRPQH